MDGRGRQGSNSSGPPSAAPVMSSYYGGSQPLTPSGDSAGSFSPRDRFWTAGGPAPDPWGSGAYNPQLLPPQAADGLTPNYSPASGVNNNSPPGPGFNLNIPGHPYPPANGHGSSGSSSELSSPFSGPSPPNPHQAAYGQAGSSPRSRQYTPSTTPSPHVGGVVNGMNGTSSHSSNDSPPTGGGPFEGYMNGEKGPEPGGHHEGPGYAPQGGRNPGRYGGEKGEGDMMSQYSAHPHQAPYYHHQNYGHYQQAASQQTAYYDPAYQPRRPFDPYAPYPPNQGGYGEGYEAYGPPSNNRAGGGGGGREPKAGENGLPKIDPSESLEGGPAGRAGESKGFDDETNFEAVLHGHMNNFSLSGEGTGGPGAYNSYDPSFESSAEDRRQNSVSQDSSGKSDDSNSMTPPGSAKKGSKKRKKSTNSPEACGKEEPEGKPSFLAIGHPQSPARSNSSQSTEGGKGGPKGPDDPTPLFSEVGDHNSNSNSSSVASTAPAGRKKKPWKKAKQVNSETLLEERERHCAQYIESQQGKSGGGVKVKEEPVLPPPPPPYYPHHYEEKNITIDHQKESEEVKKEAPPTEKRDPEPVVAEEEESSTKKEAKKDVPLVECGCFPVDEVHPEPGPFYTHLGAAHTLPELRELLEVRTGFRGPQLRFEKVIYTGKEGKTSQGCPLAKWIIRRGSYEEQLLFLVKHRKGHKCATAWIVVCCVIWEGVPPHFADNIYDTVVYKLNRFGIPTTRRSDTNEQRSCACQGIDPDTCGAAYSFGCAWSMFFNGCKYARSRNVRKFRLTEEHEESELEEKVQHLATHLGPLYERVAPDSYRNQIEHENEGLECRLGYRPGRPFSGVTACVDYCSHAHKDAHNMINGCTVTVAFTRNRSITKGDDEQYHVLPLYKLDETDENGSKEGQKQKTKKGQLELLKKFPSKVRVRKVPLLPSRRRGKTKPPSSSSAAHTHHSHHHAGGPKPSDLYSSELSSLSMPPPMKREKLSIFDELNGPGGGSDLFDTRFHPHGPPPPFSNLLMSKSHGHSKLGMGMGMSMSLEDHVQSCQISSTVIDPDTGLWSPSPYAQHPHAQAPGPPFRSYFDSSPIVPTPPVSQYSSPSQFSHNLDLGLSTSPRGGGSAATPLLPIPSNNSGTSTNVMSPSHNSGGGGGSGAPNTGNSTSGPNTSMTTTPGYTSMSPSILPSFRHTFMTEAESLSMLSSMSSPSGLGPAGTSPIADSTSSPRNGGKPGGPNPAQTSQSSAPPTNTSTPSNAFSHQEALGFNNPTSGYFNPVPVSAPSYSTSPGNSSLYHPHPHHPTPTSCLSTPVSGGGGGGTFSSGGYPSPASSFAPDAHHHHAFPGMNPWNPGMGMNSAGYGHSPYGSVVAPNPQPPPPPPYHTHHNQMSSLNMNMSPMSASYMNQYSPYANQPNFMSSQSMQHAAAAAAVASAVGMHHHGHHPPNPWASPLPPFMSGGPGGHHHHAPPPPPSCFVAPPKPKVIPEVNETYSDNEDAFKDTHLGGVAIALTHGAVILQCAKHEMHATTSLKSPNRLYPSRICLVFYQHKSMNNRFHGWSEWEKKIEAKKLQEVKLINQGKLEATPRKMKQLIKEGYLADNA